MPGSGGATVLDDLPEWIVVEEILVRLPPRDIIRCRAVRKWWQSATSTDKFMLDHHRRQPLLPILSHVVERQKTSLLLSFDAGAGQEQLCPVIRTFHLGILQATCDGLLIISHGAPANEFFICNPVTRKCAALRQLGFHYQKIVGFYRHQPSGEYRVLWVSSPTYYKALDPNYRTFYYVIAVGSNYRRYIGQGCIPQPTSQSPSLELALRGLPGSSDYPPVHHRGSLHWTLVNYHGYIMVFNTADETFRLMCCPAEKLPSQQLLLEMDGTLALCGIGVHRVTIDVWVIQDYEAEAWSFKHRIDLSVMDGSQLPDLKVIINPRMAVLNGGELLIQFFDGHVLRCDFDGKFLEYVKMEEDQDNLWLTRHCLQESLIHLPLFSEMQEEGGVSVDCGASIFRRAIGCIASSGCFDSWFAAIASIYSR